MKSWALRVAAVLLAVVALAAGGYIVFDADRRADAARATQGALEADTVRLQVVIADLRGALPAYVAPAQDRSYWAQRVAGLLQDLDARLKRIERPGIGTDTSQEIATAEEAAATLRQDDARIRKVVEQGRPGEASRLLFSDANSLATAASVALSQAVSLERARADAAVANARRRQLYALAGAAAMVLIALLLLMPLPAGAERRAEASAEAVSAEAGDGTRLFGGPLELDSLGRSGFELDSTRPPRPRPGSSPPRPLPRGPWSNARPPNARPPCQARRPPRRRLSRRSRGPRPSTRQPPRRLPIPRRRPGSAPSSRRWPTPTSSANCSAAPRPSSAPPASSSGWAA